jgi:GT2 family glycosyltransferase
MDNTKTKASVIVVSWNAKAFLLDCLKSIESQSFDGSLEIIVVDNASSDGSPQAVRENFPAVTLICNEHNYGFARANNIGIRASSGEYLFLINSDVIVRENCFEKTIRFMQARPEVGLLGPKIVGANGSVQRSCMGYPSLWNSLTRALALDSLFPKSKLFGGHLLTFWAHDEVRAVDVINGCFWLLRRRAMDEVGLLDERFLIYGEDIDWCRRFNQHGWQVVFFPDAEAIHYGGGSSANAPVRFYLEMQRANYQYFAKHHPGPASQAFLLITLLHHLIRVLGEVIAYPLVRRNRPASSLKIARCIASLRWVCAAIANPQRVTAAQRSSL